MHAVATNRDVLAAQYATGQNLRARVSSYDYLHADREEASSFEGWVLDHVDWPAAAIAADVGCGPGPYLAELSRRAARTIGFDLSVGMLREVQSRLDSGLLGVVAGDAQRVPVRDQCVDVVLAAHMLYHLADIDAAIGEFRRVLKPGGTLLVPLNGPEDKAELRAVWAEGATAALGSRFQVPSWGDRANLDNATTMLLRHFQSIAVDRLGGVFRFPTADPPMAWIGSLRQGTENLVSDDEWTAVLTETRVRIEAVIASDGEFRARKESGVVVAR